MGRKESDKLSEKQREIFEYIQVFTKKNDRMPYYRELKQFIGVVSFSAVASRINSLIRKGYLRKEKTGLFLVAKNPEEPKEKIFTDKGDEIFVDKDDYARMNQYHWWLKGSGYAERVVRRKGKRHVYYMHREIMKCPKNLRVDHINGNKLDNRKENLRICTQQQNSFNRIGNSGSGYKGVYWSSERNKWVAQIKAGSKRKSLGRFIRKEDAALAYNKAAKELFGQFAKLNVIGGNL